MADIKYIHGNPIVVGASGIEDGAVTLAKLGSDVELTPPDGSITTAKLADGAVTDAKLAQNGGVLEKVDDLKSALNEDADTIISKNLMGMRPNYYYPVVPPIKNGESFTLTVTDDQSVSRYVDYYYYDKTKTEIGHTRIYVGNKTKTVTVSGGDVAFLRWNSQPDKIIMVNRGSTAVSYEPYFEPYSSDSANDLLIKDLYKDFIVYPDSFVNGHSLETNGVLGAVSANYKTTDLIRVSAGDVLHYRLCAPSTQAIINLYSLSGAYISSVSGSGQSTMTEGTLAVAQDCFVVATNRYIEVGNEETYFYINTSLVHEVKQSVKKDAAEENTFVSGYGTLDGWKSHAIAFSALMADVEDTEGFMFFTDTHFMSKLTGEWEEYAYEIFAYLEKLYYSSPCSFVLHGGDWLGTGEARANYLYKMSALNGVFRSKFDKYALLVGNHETGNQSSEGTVFTHDTLAATLLANIGKTYYVFYANTFKMYCFDTWSSAALDSYANEQIDWFATALGSETEEHVVLAMHILHNEGVLKPMGDELTKCAAAYNSRSSYTYNGHTYDYTNATGKVGFVVAGHTHADATGTENGIPYIETVNTTTYGNTSFANLPLPVDLIKVDWDNSTLTAYRAARGSTGTTRTLTIIS